MTTEIDPRTEALIELYGGEENMKNLRPLSACEVNSIQKEKYLGYLQWPNEPVANRNRWLAIIRELDHAEQDCTDPNHDTIKTYFDQA